jgi:hypothetical protein
MTTFDLALRGKSVQPAFRDCTVMQLETRLEAREFHF